MSSSQQRIAETITLFYTADKQSEVSSQSGCRADRQGAMAGHAYKAGVEELDNVVTRDLVSAERGGNPSSFACP